MSIESYFKGLEQVFCLVGVGGTVIEDGHPTITRFKTLFHFPNSIKLVIFYLYLPIHTIYKILSTKNYLFFTIACII